MTLSRKKLTLEEAQSGIQPVPLSKAEWKLLHKATKKYGYDLFWKQFQYCFQKIERSFEKREAAAKLSHKLKKKSPYSDAL